jgi:hypothetical protein
MTKYIDIPEDFWNDLTTTSFELFCTECKEKKVFRPPTLDRKNQYKGYKDGMHMFGPRFCIFKYNPVTQEWIHYKSGHQ